MSKVIKYNLTYLGTIELEDDENLTDGQIMSLIAEAAYDTCRAEIEYANDVEYEIEGEEDEDWLEEQAEIAEYERIARNNPYIFKEDEI